MTPAFKLTGHSDFVTDLCFAPDGKLLASSSDDGSARLWDLADRMELTAFRGSEKPVRRVAFLDGGKQLLSVPQANPAELYVWDVPGEKALAVVNPTHDDYGELLAASPDGSVFGTAAQSGEVKLWDGATRALRATLEGLTDTPRDLRFSPDGKYLAASSKWTLALWVVSRGKMRAAPQLGDGEATGLAFSPDGAWLAVGQARYGAYKASQFEVASGSPRPGFSAPETGCGTVAYSPDGKWLVLHNGSETGILVLDAATGVPKVNLEGGYLARSAGLAFSPDSKWLAAGGQNDIEVFNFSAAVG